MASFFEIDDVIDPSESRTWISHGIRFRATPGAVHGDGSRRFIDTW
jgi:hypothetical protein